MPRVLLIQCVVLGVMLSGCAAGPGAQFVRTPAEAPGPPAPDCIGAGAVARTEEPASAAAPPPQSAERKPPEEPSWGKKVMRKGGGAIAAAAKAAGEFTFTVLVLGGIVGLAILYGAASANSNQHWR